MRPLNDFLRANRPDPLQAPQPMQLPEWQQASGPVDKSQIDGAARYFETQFGQDWRSDPQAQLRALGAGMASGWDYATMAELFGTTPEQVAQIAGGFSRDRIASQGQAWMTDNPGLGIAGNVESFYDHDPQSGLWGYEGRPGSNTMQYDQLMTGYMPSMWQGGQPPAPAPADGSIPRPLDYGFTPPAGDPTPNGAMFRQPSVNAAANQTARAAVQPLDPNSFLRGSSRRAFAPAQPAATPGAPNSRGITPI
jgi:hypothetical protein